jgi:hypothetical protein
MIRFESGVETEVESRLPRNAECDECLAHVTRELEEEELSGVSWRIALVADIPLGTSAEHTGSNGEDSLPLE